MSIPLGHLADRIGARRVVAAGAVAMAVATLGLGFAGSFWALVAARAVQGVGDAAVWGAGVAWVAARAPAGAVAGRELLERRGDRRRHRRAVHRRHRHQHVRGPADVHGRRRRVARAGGVGALEPDARAAAERRIGVRAAIAAAFSESLILASVIMILAVAVIGGALQVLVPLHLSAVGVERSGIGAAYSVGAMLGAVAILASGRARRPVRPDSARRGRLHDPCGAERAAHAPAERGARRGRRDRRRAGAVGPLRRRLSAERRRRRPRASSGTGSRSGS